MVDVFEVAPPRPHLHGPPAPFALGIPDNRFAQYQNLLSKLSVTDGADPEARIEEYLDADADATADANAAIQAYGDTLPTKANVAGPFVGNFTDAARVVP